MSVHDRDLKMPVVLGIILIVIILIWLVPSVPVSLLGAFLIAIFGFFFATVSSRMVGLIGSSNNPVSGMAIATLLISTFVLKATGNTGMGRYDRCYRNRFYHLCHRSDRR